MERKRIDDSGLASRMRDAQAGDARAYAELLRAVTPALRQFIASRRRFLQPADIEDIVQEVLLSLHAVRATYDHERPFMPWLLTIAHNRLADAARRHFRRGTYEVPAEPLSVTFFEDATNVEAYGDPEALQRAIRKLPPGQREAIEMLKLQEMSLKEAATAMDTTVGALKVSVHRAMAALRKSLKG